VIKTATRQSLGEIGEDEDDAPSAPAAATLPANGRWTERTPTNMGMTPLDIAFEQARQDSDEKSGATIG